MDPVAQYSAEPSTKTSHICHKMQNLNQASLIIIYFKDLHMSKTIV